MPRTPSLRRHKPSGRAVVTLNGHDYYLGRWPVGQSKPPCEVQSNYDRLLAEWLATGRGRSANPGVSANVSVDEVALAFWEHATQHYRRPDGTTTNELEEYKRTLRALRHLYGQMPAADFGPLALKAVRQLLIDGYRHPKFGNQAPLARGVVNQRISRLRRVFKWAVANELVKPAVLEGLKAVTGLQAGRTTASETQSIRPVSEAVVNDTLPLLNRFVAAMVRVQLLTAARPGEICAIRGCDLDTTGKVWLYRPCTHKTQHHGHRRVIAIGPQAQAILKQFLRADTNAYLFSPRLAMEEYHRARRQARKTPMTPIQAKRQSKVNPRKTPGEHYTTASYHQAIAKAIKRHNAIKSTSEQIPYWHLHQLRHTAATKLRREFGIDTARVVLGHRSPAITETYAEIDSEKACVAMAKVG